MTTSSKTPAARTPKTVVKPAAKKPATRAAGKTVPKIAEQPSLRFHHTTSLRAKTDAVLNALEAKPEAPRHGEAMADLVHELIEAGMDYYFFQALKKAQTGFVMEQSARLGLSGAVRIISSVSRQFIERMDRAQLLIVSRHIRELY
ncbi:hypothetical protein LHU53_18480 [Rhodoferax sp. U2-2l]|uniref:hypothetical protein n=1 Tax=Rhodoferax sp. U2-2l TaxID=2884000 RepID=UPI001D0A57AD|nr:hypothetical protein [Rhodoferax sp. U2-2l]MCB8748881.1 hypothetical protein [Rhodoferax sp. U2-2l]